MAQIQLNIVDSQIQAGVEGLHYAGAKGIGGDHGAAKGGRLAQTIPQDVLDLWARPGPNVPRWNGLSVGF